MAGRLAEAEDTISSLQEKIASLEKAKARAKAEFDDLSAEAERHNTNATIISIIVDTRPDDLDGCIRRNAILTCNASDARRFAVGLHAGRWASPATMTRPRRCLSHFCA